MSFLSLVDRYLEPYRADESAEEQAFPFSADMGAAVKLAGRAGSRAVKTLYLGLMKIYRGTSDSEMAGRLIFGMRQEATAVLDEHVLLRAAALGSRDGSALLIPSQPEQSLSTLAALLVRAGMPFIADEITRINPVTRAASDSALPLLVDAAMLPPEEGVKPMRTGVGDPTVRRRPVTVSELGGTVSGDRDIGRVLFPVWEPGARTGIAELTHADAVFRFASAALNLHVWESRGIALMRELLERARVGVIVVGSLEDAVALILEDDRS